VEIRKQYFFILPAIKFLNDFNPMSGTVGGFMNPTLAPNKTANVLFQFQQVEI
jgi:hypothetical protein